MRNHENYRSYIQIKKEKMFQKGGEEMRNIAQNIMSLSIFPILIKVIN